MREFSGSLRRHVPFAILFSVLDADSGAFEQNPIALERASARRIRLPGDVAALHAIDGLADGPAAAKSCLKRIVQILPADDCSQPLSPLSRCVFVHP